MHWLIMAGALVLTALVYCCIWVAADADRRAIDQNWDGDKHEQTNNQAG